MHELGGTSTDIWEALRGRSLQPETDKGLGNFVVWKPAEDEDTCEKNWKIPEFSLETSSALFPREKKVKKIGRPQNTNKSHLFVRNIPKFSAFVTYDTIFIFIASCCEIMVKFWKMETEQNKWINFFIYSLMKLRHSKKKFLCSSCSFVFFVKD